MVGIIVSVGTILLIIPGIIFAMMYAQAPFIMAEHKELGVFEAMHKSKEMMFGKKWNLFVFHFSFIGHFLLSAITFGIYGLYFIPYYQLALINYYQHLKAAEAPLVIDHQV